MDGHEALESFSSIRLRTLKLLSVCLPPNKCVRTLLTLAAKFTGYQYGGRPLGLTYVKYVNAGSGDAMEGTEQAGLAPDQIM